MTHIVLSTRNTLTNKIRFLPSLNPCIHDLENIYLLGNEISTKPCKINKIAKDAHSPWASISSHSS